MKDYITSTLRRVGSAAVFGASAGVAVTYFTDWKLVLQYLPYYNGKFPKEEEES